MKNKMPKRSKVIQQIFELISGTSIQFLHTIDFNKVRGFSGLHDLGDRIGNKPYLKDIIAIDKKLLERGIEATYYTYYELVNNNTQMLYKIRFNKIRFDDGDVLTFEKSKYALDEAQKRFNVNAYCVFDRVQREVLHDEEWMKIYHNNNALRLAELANESKKTNYSVEEVSKYMTLLVKENFYEGSDTQHIYRLVI